MRVLEWLVLLPLWRRFIKSPGGRTAAAIGTGIVWVVIIILIATSGGGDGDSGETVQDQDTSEPTMTAAAEPTEAPEATATPEPTEPPEQDDLNLTLGQTANVGDAEVTAHSFRLDSGGEFFAPDAGNVWVVVDATIVNTGDDEYNFSSLLQLAARDTEGREYDVNLLADVPSGLDGTILAGDNLRGETAFEVPETALAGLQFVFKQVFGSGQARWKLE